MRRGVSVGKAIEPRGGGCRAWSRGPLQSRGHWPQLWFWKWAETALGFLGLKKQHRNLSPPVCYRPRGQTHRGLAPSRHGDCKCIRRWKPGRETEHRAPRNLEGGHSPQARGQRSSLSLGTTLGEPRSPACGGLEGFAPSAAGPSVFMGSGKGSGPRRVRKESRGWSLWPPPLHWWSAQPPSQNDYPLP